MLNEIFVYSITRSEIEESAFSDIRKELEYSLLKRTATGSNVEREKPELWDCES
jgi:hypothetical protein